MSNLTPLVFNKQRIMTTKVLAEQYGTNEQNISRNFTRNSERFIEGKHYFKLEGEELKEFKGYVLNDESLDIENVDFITVGQKCPIANGGYQESINHAVKLDMAKEIAMIADNEIVYTKLEGMNMK